MSDFTLSEYDAAKVSSEAKGQNRPTPSITLGVILELLLNAVLMRVDADIQEQGVCALCHRKSAISDAMLCQAIRDADRGLIGLTSEVE